MYGIQSSSMEDYEEREAKIAKIVKAKLAKAKDSEVIGYVKDEEKPERQAMCRLAHQVFEEAVHCYDSGDYTWDEFRKELNKALKALA
jgi:hypothetical protein